MSETQRRTGIECSRCSGPTFVANTKNFGAWIRRYRVCHDCGHTFRTRERPEAASAEEATQRENLYNALLTAIDAVPAHLLKNRKLASTLGASLRRTIERLDSAPRQSNLFEDDTA